MLTIRPVTVPDAERVRALIEARCAWMEERDIPSWRANAGALTELAIGEGADSWLLLEQQGQAVGLTTFQPEPPPWGWTSQERAEAAYYLHTTITHPHSSIERPGSLIALWAVDRAASHGLAWVRRGCLSPRLVRYYRTQGFALHHRVERSNNTVYLMARRAEPLPEIAAQVRTTDATG